MQKSVQADAVDMKSITIAGVRSFIVTFVVGFYFNLLDVIGLWAQD